MNKTTLETALAANLNERIEWPVCGDEVPAFELATDHAHSKELLELVADLLRDQTAEEGLRDGVKTHADSDFQTTEND